MNFYKLIVDLILNIFAKFESNRTIKKKREILVLGAHH